MSKMRHFIKILLILLLNFETYGSEQVLIAVACEDHIFYANCHSSFQVIHIVKAIFGRFSLRPCIKNTDNMNPKKIYLPYDQMDLQCSAANTTNIVKDRCDNHQKCMLEASTLIFGDPCVGTSKYLEIHYQCVNKDKEIQSTVDDEEGFGIYDTDVLKGKTNSTIAYSSLSSHGNEVTQLPTSTDSSSSSSSSTSSDNCCETVSLLPDNSSSEPIPNPLTSVCPQQFVRNILWPETEIGVSLQQMCPDNAYGFARWYCSSNSTWYPTFPDLSECSSPWSIELENMISNRSSSYKNLSILVYNASRTKEMYGGDIKRVLKVINSIATLESPQHKDFINDTDIIALNLLGSSNQLISANQTKSWLDLPSLQQRKSATLLLQNVENIGRFLLRYAIIPKNIPSKMNTSLLYDYENLALKVVKIDREAKAENYIVDFSVNNNTNAPNPHRLFSNATEKIEIINTRSSTIDNASRSGYSTMYSIALLDGNLKFLLPEYDEGENVSRIGTRVISISYLAEYSNFHNANKTDYNDGAKGLSESVVLLTFPFTRDSTKIVLPKCVYLQYGSSDQEGRWSGDGCWLHEHTNSTITCACNHMTSFAVILDVVGIEIPLPHQTALIIITQVGCAISIICLFLSVVTFQALRNLLNERMIIHKHLCLNLLFAEVLFVAGIQSTSLKIGCSLIAVFLHFFFLCAFMWMLVEGLQLYTMLVEVFESDKSRHKFYLLMAYGIPSIVVILSLIINPRGYGNHKHCWLTTKDYFIFSFVGPVIVILIANFIFLGIALFIMGRHFTRMPNHSDKSKLIKLRTWLKGAFILIFLMGLTWSFGLFFINQETLFAAYIFTILNSFQGLFIFIFHCLLNDKVINEYRKLLQRSPLVPVWLKTYTTTSSFAGSSLTLPKKIRSLNNEDSLYDKVEKHSRPNVNSFLPFNFGFLNCKDLIKKKVTSKETSLGKDNEKFSQSEFFNESALLTPNANKEVVKNGKSKVMLSVKDHTISPKLYPSKMNTDMNQSPGQWSSFGFDGFEFIDKILTTHPPKSISELVIGPETDECHKRGLFVTTHDGKQHNDLPVTNLDDLSASLALKTSFHFSDPNLTTSNNLSNSTPCTNVNSNVIPGFRAAKSDDLSRTMNNKTFLNDFNSKNGHDSMVPSDSLFTQNSFSNHINQREGNQKSHNFQRALSLKDNDLENCGDQVNLLLPNNHPRYRTSSLDIL